MRKTYIIISVLLTIFAPALATANDTITLNGTIVAPSCDISTTEATQNISLGVVPANSLTSIGQLSAPVPFSIHLTNCNYPSTLMWTYTGTADDSGNNLALTDAADVAKGINVGIYSDASGSTPVNLNSQQSIALTTDSHTLDTWLAYKVTSLPVSAGSANAILYIDFAYQ